MEELIYDSWIPWMNLDVWIIFVSELKSTFSGDFLCFLSGFFKDKKRGKIYKG